MKLIITTVFIIILTSIIIYLLMYRFNNMDPEKATKANFRKRIIDRYKYQ